VAAVSDQSRVIGRVSSVDSTLLTIELDPTTPGYVKGGMSGIIPIGSINSYVTMTAGITKIVAVVTSIKVREAPPPTRGDFRNSSMRIIEASMIGRIEGGAYRPGIATYPALFTPVSGATPQEIAQIFKPKGSATIRFGEAVVQPGQDVLLDIDTLLSKHCAILGSTGAGKSCSVMAVLDGLLSHSLPSATIIIFDTNGEYAKAFQSEPRASLAVPLVIGGMSKDCVSLSLPHWFMDNNEHLSLFRASEGVQAPLLLRSVADARLSSVERQQHITSALLIMRQIQHYDSIRDISSSRKPQELLHGALASLHQSAMSYRSQYDHGTSEYTFWDRVATIAVAYQSLGLNPNAWDQPPTLEQNEGVDNIFNDIRTLASDLLSQAGMSIEDVASDFDAPRYYSLEQLVQHYLPRRIDVESLVDSRFRSYVAGMLLRIGKLLADSRYNFFTRVQKFDDALALFLRLLLGWYPLPTSTVEPPWKTSYLNQYPVDQQKHRVIILDLSAVGSDVLEHVAALVARIIIDFCQRLERRASLPILMVLEEAHRYVPPPSTDVRHSSEVFERIAKEGRKFGISIMVASQRPSELSQTVLAQCGTMIAHRIVSAEDQDIIRHATPFASREVLQQLPGLATQHAIVLGEAVPAPTYVRVRDVPHRPRSEDPSYFAEWAKPPSTDTAEVIDGTARAWERPEPSFAGLDEAALSYGAFTNEDEIPF
jgi:uncharacterized protein